ncbi:TatD family hydrolase [bacterium]|nr:TatD family hydrolase [bacterium]
MSLIDSHCHLDAGAFDDDRPAVIERALAAGVTRMVTIATDLAGAHKALAIARTRPEIFVALGMHPHVAKHANDETLAALTELASDDRVVAWGEIGLDYHYDHSPREAQHDAFRRQIRVARKLGLPIVIHCRKAMDDCLAVLADEAEGAYRGVFHCFSGSGDEAERVLALGFDLSFTGTITFKTEMPEHDAVRAAGIDRVLIETDSPYLAPKPYRGKRNEPAYVAEVARALARILGVSQTDAGRAAAKNTRRLFSRMR